VMGDGLFVGLWGGEGVRVEGVRSVRDEEGGGLARDGQRYKDQQM